MIVEEMRLLGIIITSDMKWTVNTLKMVTRANTKLWMLRRLKNSEAKTIDLVDIYSKLSGMGPSLRRRRWT